jgi:hypothetical protein|tara:strand:+ start:590 stop:781 length:192 start_codon:yes stop_codon:yes gene_type:complete
MDKKKDYVLIKDINKALDELKFYKDSEMDRAVSDDNLDDHKIRRICSQRVMIERIRLTLNRDT